MFILVNDIAGTARAINLSHVEQVYREGHDSCTVCFQDVVVHVALPFGMFVSKLQEAGLLEKE